MTHVLVAVAKNLKSVVANNMKIVFISGPLTSGAGSEQPARKEYIANNVKKAEAYQIALANAGIGSFCAHTHTMNHHEKGSKAPEKYYYELDLEFLYRASDAVLAVPGWEKSQGAKAEIEWAKHHKLPVFYPKSPDNIDDIIIWAQK